MEEIFIDANPFIYFLCDIKGKADRVQKILENKNHSLFTSFSVLNEVKFRLLINKAIEELKTDKKYELLDYLKRNAELRRTIMEKYLKFFMSILPKINVLEVDKNTEILSCALTIEMGLLPTDASIVSLMKKSDICKIMTNDMDFNNLPGIEVIRV